MKNETIIFSLNESEGLELILKQPLATLDCCGKTQILFFQGNNRILIGNDTLLYLLNSIIGILEEALADNLYLHESINHNIGYLYNRYCDALWNEKPEIKQFVYQYQGNSKMWVGNEYHLWSATGVGSWIFNNNNGDIIFELAPLYPYKYHDPEKTNTILFESWIQDYEPYLIRTIPIPVAEQWLEQAQKILNIIIENIKRFEHEEERKQLH